MAPGSEQVAAHLAPNFYGVRHLVRLGLALALLSALWIGAPAEAKRGSGLSELRTDAARPYRLFVPSGPPRNGRELVVALHGCTQTSLDFAIGSRWPELAEARNFVVLFPEQPTAENGMNCWNWFDPAQQTRDGEEPKAITDLALRVASEYRVDPSRIFVTGVSAGADMTAILGAVYPDVYAATAPFAGCAFATCADVSGTLAYQAMGDKARVVPSMVVQGTADPLNNLAMGETLIAQQVGTNDWADDGSLNASVTPDEPDHVDATDGDNTQLCVRNESYPCAAGATGWSGYPYTIERYRSGGRVVVEAWIVHGLAHNYPGGRLQEDDPATPENDRTSFVDPAGPDITTAFYEFFLRNPLT